MGQHRLVAEVSLHGRRVRHKSRTLQRRNTNRTLFETLSHLFEPYEGKASPTQNSIDIISEQYEAPSPRACGAYCTARGYQASRGGYEECEVQPPAVGAAVSLCQSRLLCGS